jgi:subtilisin family serine protease
MGSCCDAIVPKNGETMNKRRFRLLAAVFLFFVMLWGAVYYLFPDIKKTDDAVWQTFPDRLSNLPAVDSAYQEGEVLVKFKNKVTAAEASMLANDLAAATVKEFRILSQSGHSAYFLFRSASRSTKQLLAIMRNNPDVEAVSPNYRRRLQRLPNDPKFNRLWGMKKVAAAAAWEKNIGSAEIVLAVLDTGIDYRHEDLAANMWRNPHEIAGNGIDDDGNGFIDDVYGYDFAADNTGNQDSDPMDIDSHGTHVAGTIAAVGNNGIGVCGINWNARIMALKGVRPDMNIYDSDSIEAIEYAVLMKRDYGVNVVAINASFGGSGNNQLQKDAIAEAGNQGIAFICAAGNDGTDNDTTPFYPAAYDLPNIIAVAATDANDQLASFSNYGAYSVDIAAPGASIFSTVLTGMGQEAALTSGPKVYHSYPLEFTGLTPAVGLSRQLVDCGSGKDSSFFPAAVSGNIALIERGDKTFKEKILNAQKAGALAAVIYNNEAGIFSGTLGEAGDWIPVIALAREDGLLEKAKGIHMVTVIVRVSNYGVMDGTSMAAPHVCGAVGLLAAQYPLDDLTKRINRIYSGADRLDSLDGKMKTGARLNLARSILQNMVLTLAVFRIQASVWVIKKDYAQVYFSVEKDQDSEISGEKYNIFRSRAGGSFQMIKEITAFELQNNSYTYYDKYLDSGVIYTYLLEVRNAQGEVIVISTRQSI